MPPTDSEPSNRSADSTTTEGTATQNIVMQQSIHSIQPANLSIAQSMLITTDKADTNKPPAETDQPPPPATDQPDPSNISNPSGSMQPKLPPLPSITGINKMKQDSKKLQVSFEGQSSRKDAAPTTTKPDTARASSKRTVHPRPSKDMLSAAGHRYDPSYLIIAGGVSGNPPHEGHLYMFSKALTAAQARGDQVVGAWMVPAIPDYVYTKIVRERSNDYHLVMPIDLRINLIKAMLAGHNEQL